MTSTAEDQFWMTLVSNRIAITTGHERSTECELRTSFRDFACDDLFIVAYQGLHVRAGP